MRPTISCCGSPPRSRTSSRIVRLASFPCNFCVAFHLLEQTADAFTGLIFRQRSCQRFKLEQASESKLPAHHVLPQIHRPLHQRPLTFAVIGAHRRPAKQPYFAAQGTYQIHCTTAAKISSASYSRSRPKYGACLCCPDDGG